MQRVPTDPVPPRYTFDDESSSDGEDDPSNRQVSGYQDGDEDDIPKRKERMMESDDIKVALKEEIHESSALVIGVELLYHVDRWFGTSKEVGTISTEKVCHSYENALTTID